MNRTRILALGGLLTGLAFLFQIAPVLFSEAFVTITALSALPVYIISRVSPRIGLMSFVSAGILILIFSLHEGLFFFLINGPLGLSLGLCSHYKLNRIVTPLITAFTLTLALVLVNFAIGIPVLGVPLPGTILVQLAILLGFSLVYSTAFMFFAGGVYKAMKMKNVE